MQPVLRAFFTLGTVLAIGLALWFSLTLLGIFMLVGGTLVLVFALRQFLLEKGILNPRLGVPMDPPSEMNTPGANPKITVIETSFTHIDHEKK